MVSVYAPLDAVTWTHAPGRPGGSPAALVGVVLDCCRCRAASDGTFSALFRLPAKGRGSIGLGAGTSIDEQKTCVRWFELELMNAHRRDEICWSSPTPVPVPVPVRADAWARCHWSSRLFGYPRGFCRLLPPAEVFLLLFCFDHHHYHLRASCRELSSLDRAVPRSSGDPRACPPIRSN